MTQPARRSCPPREPVPDDDPRYNHPSRCGHYTGKNGDWHRRSDNSRCLGWIVKGTTTCPFHSGTSHDVAKARGEVATEVKKVLAYTGPIVDSGEIMLKASSAAWYRAQMLTAELDRTVGDHETLRDALTGDSYSVDEQGRSVKTGEYIRAMAQLEAQWWDRAFQYAAKVTAAKLAIADRAALRLDRQAEALAHLAQAVLLDPRIGLTPAQRAVLGEVWRDHSTRLGIAGT